MSETFQPIRSKVRPTDIRDLRTKFIVTIGKGYQIRAPTNHEQFYSMSDSPLEILVRVKALKAGLTFHLDPFIESYLYSSGLTYI